METSQRLTANTVAEPVEGATVKSGATPPDWEAHPAKNRQKDKDARWTKKHGRAHFGYKNHISIDRRHKLVRRYAVSTASVHDSQKLGDVQGAHNTAGGVWADSAYRSQAIEDKLVERGMTSHIHQRGRGIKKSASPPDDRPNPRTSIQTVSPSEMLSPSHRGLSA